MLSDLELIGYSLELNLYISRIMMEHSMFIVISIPKKEEKYKRIFLEEMSVYQDILKELILFSNGKISESFINSNQLVTDYTIICEQEIKKYYDILIDEEITKDLINLNSGIPDITKENIEKVNMFNRKMYDKLLVSLDVFNELDVAVKKRDVVISIYSSYLDHVIDEIKVLLNSLERLLNKVDLDPSYVYNSQYYYTDLMRGHSVIFKNLLDFNNSRNISKINSFIKKYKKILANYNNDVNPYVIDKNNDNFLMCTYSFIDFNEILLNQVLKNEIQMTLPVLLIDHILRETNHFLTHFKYYKK